MLMLLSCIYLACHKLYTHFYLVTIWDLVITFSVTLCYSNLSNLGSRSINVHSTAHTRALHAPQQLAPACSGILAVAGQGHPLRRPCMSPA
jgi:hypothetical protein